MVTYTPDDENIVNASVTVVINDELLKCATTEEVISFFNNSLNLADISVAVASEQK